MSALNQTLHEANSKMRHVLSLFKSQSSAASHPAHFTSADLSSLLADLRRVGEQLRSSTPTTHASEELVEYHAHLQQLRLVLPRLQAQLAAEQIRLHREHTHLDAAANWSRANKAIL